MGVVMRGCTTKDMNTAFRDMLGGTLSLADERPFLHPSASESGLKIIAVLRMRRLRVKASHSLAGVELQQWGGNRK